MMLHTYNGVPIPAMMYGTAWKKDATTRLVEQAVDAGFTAIDTANQIIHYDEARVGEALQALAARGVARSRLFLQTKFTPVNGQDHRTPYDPHASPAQQVKQSFDSSLQHLRTDYLDSYVLHGPTSRYGLTPADWEIWAAMEALYESGNTKMIGVSNVSASQLTQLCTQAKHKPMVVQNRCYAAFGWDKDVRQICRTQGLIYQAFSLLTANREVFVDSEIRAMAQRYQATIPQVIFRFAMQVGMLPMTGTTSPQHMKEDLQSDAFTLTPAELRHIEAFGL